MGNAAVQAGKRATYPAYKPSGAPWLGDVPEHWEVRRLKYSADLINQKVDGAEADLPYMGLEHIESWTGKRQGQNGDASSDGQANLFRRGDVLFGKLRPYLTKAYAADSEGICTGELLVLRPKAVEQKFLLDYVLNPDFVTIVDSSTYGAKMPRANWDFIGNLPALIPPLVEQKAIAAFLDRETARTDALIERKRRQIELLQEKRSALISHAATKGLDPHAPMKDSGIDWLGQIPKHWRIVPLKYSLLPRGGAIKTGPFGSQLLSSDMASGDVKVYNQRNVLDRDFLSGENYVSDDKYEELKSFTVFPQGVLITTRGTIGRCALLPDNAERGILHPCLMRVQPNPLITSPEYVALLIQDSGIVLLQLQLLSNATTIEVIYSESLKSVRLPLPPASEQQAILTYVTREAERHDALISKVQDSIDVLREHRTTLISAAVTGKIDVRGEVA